MSETTEEESSYKQTFRSSLLVGGSQGINILIGIIKNKVLAVLLGPTGIGIMGVYSALAVTISSIAGLGIGSSGVRQVAEAIGEGDENKKGFIIKFIRKTLLLTGIISVIMVIFFSRVLAELSFGGAFKNQYVSGIMIISGLVLFDTLASGERAILQGVRKLKELATAQVAGALIGAIASIAVVYAVGEKGISFFLVLSSFFIFLVLRMLARRVSVSSSVISSIKIKKEQRALLSLGLAFLITALAGNLVAYILRMIIVKENGITGVGIYQASWGLVNVGFNVVLAAMGTDFYPRLVTVANNTLDTNKAVNEQAEITLLLSLPIVLCLYLFAPIILKLFFSTQFLSGTELTRWLAISCFFKGLCWPLGYIIIAKGSKKLFVVTSLLWEAVHIPIIFFCIRYWGVEGIGISYVVVYSIVLLGATLISQHYYKFNWNQRTIKSALWAFAIITSLVIINRLNIPPVYFFSIGVVLTVLAFLRTISSMKNRLGLDLGKLVRRNQ